MQRNRRLLVGFTIVVVLAGSVWAYKKLTYDDRMVAAYMLFQGAKSEFATGGGTLPMWGDYDIGLGFFDIVLTPAAAGLTLLLQPSDHELALSGDLVFHTMLTRITLPMDGVEVALSIYDAAQPAADGSDGPLFIGNLTLTPTIQPPLSDPNDL